eukprot:11186592-Lingulodinium_polyedra.AAC.1
MSAPPPAMPPVMRVAASACKAEMAVARMGLLRAWETRDRSPISLRLGTHGNLFGFGKVQTAAACHATGEVALAEDLATTG